VPFNQWKGKRGFQTKQKKIGIVIQNKIKSIANMYRSQHCKIHLVNNTKTTLSKLVIGMKVFGSHPKNII
jgi:hypothetical protein